MMGGGGAERNIVNGATYSEYLCSIAILLAIISSYTFNNECLASGSAISVSSFARIVSYDCLDITV